MSNMYAMSVLSFLLMLLLTAIFVFIYPDMFFFMLVCAVLLFIWVVLYDANRG